MDSKMDPVDPQKTVLEFNDYINGRNIDGLSSLMPDDYTFIDTDDNVITGKKNGVSSWKKFFALVPEYKNVFQRVLIRGNLVIVVGYSICPNKLLDGPAIWMPRSRKVWSANGASMKTRQKIEPGSESHSCANAH